MGGAAQRSSEPPPNYGAKRTEPGSLPFDYRPGFRALKKWNYAGWLTVESNATDNPEAALGRALAYLRRQWSEALAPNRDQ